MSPVPSQARNCARRQAGPLGARAARQVCRPCDQVQRGHHLPAAVPIRGHGSHQRDQPRHAAKVDRLQHPSGRPDRAAKMALVGGAVGRLGRLSHRPSPPMPTRRRSTGRQQRPRWRRPRRASWRSGIASAACWAAMAARWCGRKRVGGSQRVAFAGVDGRSGGEADHDSSLSGNYKVFSTWSLISQAVSSVRNVYSPGFTT